MRASRSGEVGAAGLARSLFGARRLVLAALAALLAPALPSLGLRAEPAPDDLVHQIEEARGLAFLRPPAIVEAPAGDPAFDDVRARAAGLPLFRVAGPPREEAVTSAVADPERDRVVATPEASAQDVHVALSHLLDAQHYPGLVETARTARGDPGVALRAVLSASAFATATGGLGRTPEDPPGDVFSGDTFAISEPVDTSALLRTPLLAATGFLRALDDREAAFARPPLSTEQILRPGRWSEPDRPLALDGAPPAAAGCRATQDESLGLFALARAIAARAATVPGRALAGWAGDRIVRFDCEGPPRAERWIYVVELDRETDAAAFASAADALLPAELPRPLEAFAVGRRAVAAHGFAPAEARGFASALAARPLRGLSDL